MQSLTHSQWEMAVAKYTTESKGSQMELLNKEVELPLSTLRLKNGMDPESSLCF